MQALWWRCGASGTTDRTSGVDGLTEVAANLDSDYAADDEIRLDRPRLAPTQAAARKPRFRANIPRNEP